MSTFRFTPGERHIYHRLPKQSPSAWAAEHLIVPDGPSAGSRWRREVTPYTVGIMDAWAEPWVEEVRVCGTPQSGKTMLLYACMGYAIDRRPGPRMLAMPDDPAIAKMLEAKLKPLFRRTAPVRRLLRKFRSGGVFFRDGTALHLASAQSPSQRASISIQDLFLDEEDLYKQFAGQGVPVVDLIERTRQYRHKRKILRVSKPIGGEDSSIWIAATKQADELRHYEARCPACSAFQRLEEPGLVCTATTTDPQRIKRDGLARYKCAACGYLWTDHMRDVAVSAGRWRAEASVPRPKTVGFHLPAILSRAVSLSEILAEKTRADASDDPDAKQAYVNGYWAKPYTPVVEETDEQKILTLRDAALPPRVVPPGFIALTAGIDMQKHGFWFLACAWTAALECFILDYGRLTDFGDVYSLVWETLYPQASGQPLPLWRAVIDTGGTKTDVDLLTRTEECYQFVRQNGGGRLFASKGASHQQIVPVKWSVVDKMPRTHAAIPGGLQLFTLDTAHFKGLASARLKPTARQPIILHAEAEATLAQQLSAERLVRGRGGAHTWEQIRKDNHYFDCLCMNFAAVNAAWTPSLQWLAEQTELAKQSAAAPQAQPSTTSTVNPYTGEEIRS